MRLADTRPGDITLVHQRGHAEDRLSLHPLTEALNKGVKVALKFLVRIKTAV